MPGALFTSPQGADADPEGKTAEKEDALLGAEANEKKCDGGADHGPDNG
jgi:hypothetical protein